jgi:uncharacterized protein (DUF2267 family)
LPPLRAWPAIRVETSEEAVMSNDPFDATMHKTNEWLAQINERLGWQDRHRAWAALRAVLHALRDRLSVEEAAALGAQLPLLVRGVYYENFQPRRLPVRMRTRQELYERVGHELRGYDDMQLEEATAVVLDVLCEHISGGEAKHLGRVLPRDLAELFP